jgi:transcriptional regulator with XRE-family HTH domain
VPPVKPEDRQFAARLANVLRELRHQAGWTQEEAAEAIGVPIGKLGRWERAEHPPKGYDLGRAYRAYKAIGAQWEWFFDPPEVVVLNPVRDHLAGLAHDAAALGHEDVEREQAAPRAAARKRGGPRRTRPS